MTLDITQKFNKLIENREKVTIEFGPGHKKKFDNSIAIDCVPLECVDIVTDVQSGLSFIPDSSIDLIYSSHFLEHIDNLEVLMAEFQRILKPGGCIKSVVPHFSNPYFYSDYTHKNLWGLYTISYFSKKSFFKRGVPSFYNDIDFNIESIKINFYSPFIGRKPFKKMLNFVFNCTRYMQELYEENFVYLFPAYEIEFNLRKKLERA